MSQENSTSITMDNNAAAATTSKKQDSAEKQESYDTLAPIKGNFDNKAFELEDVDIHSNQKNPFDRTERPGSMMSIRSNASTSSRSSINCTSGRIRCPNMRLNKFFSYKPDVGFTKASNDVQRLILPEKYGVYLGSWLLIEISTWDFHREKIVMLSEKAVFVVSYDFINSKISDYEIIELVTLKKVKYGNLKYSKGSMMNEYLYGAVRLAWGDEQLGFFQKWSMFENAPYKTFTSHQILYNEKEKETQFWNCDEFINSLEMAISKLPECSQIDFKEEPVEIENYVGFGSVLYNQNWLGFQLDRNGLNF